MRKVRIFEFLCPKKHSKIRTGSIRKPPVSLLPLKNFFHADALAHGFRNKRIGIGMEACYGRFSIYKRIKN